MAVTTVRYRFNMISIGKNDRIKKMLSLEKFHKELLPSILFALFWALYVWFYLHFEGRSGIRNEIIPNVLLSFFTCVMIYQVVGIFASRRLIARAIIDECDLPVFVDDIKQKGGFLEVSYENIRATNSRVVLTVAPKKGDFVFLKQLDTLLPDSTTQPKKNKLYLPLHDIYKYLDDDATHYKVFVIKIKDELPLEAVYKRSSFDDRLFFQKRLKRKGRF